MKEISENVGTVERVAEMILKSKYLVAFTGAGISTESGLSDFRGKDGIWTRKDKGLPPKQGKHFDEAEPNTAHLTLVKLQELGILKFLISQNVDNLHLKSGIHPELLAELHGNYTIMKCMNCDARYKRLEIGWDRDEHGRGFRTEPTQENQPKCPECNGRIISSIVNFNDAMPEEEMLLSKEHSVKCDLMLVIGSSLSVNPAAFFPRMAHDNGAEIVIINIDSTKMDKLADTRIYEKAGVFMEKVVQRIKAIRKDKK